MPNYTSILAELRTEKALLDDVIAACERLARGHGRRRGRPPLWMSQASGGPTRRARVFSMETRAKMSRAQKKRWAAAHA